MSDVVIPLDDLLEQAKGLIFQAHYELQRNSLLMARFYVQAAWGVLATIDVIRQNKKQQQDDMPGWLEVYGEFERLDEKVRGAK